MIYLESKILPQSLVPTSSSHTFWGGMDRLDPQKAPSTSFLRFTPILTKVWLENYKEHVWIKHNCHTKNPMTVTLGTNMSWKRKITFPPWIGNIYFFSWEGTISTKKKWLYQILSAHFWSTFFRWFCQQNKSTQGTFIRTGDPMDEYSIHHLSASFENLLKKNYGM